MNAGKDILQHLQTLFVRGKISNYHGNFKFSNLIFWMVIVLSFPLGFRSYVTTRSCLYLRLIPISVTSCTAHSS